MSSDAEKQLEVEPRAEQQGVDGAKLGEEGVAANEDAESNDDDDEPQVDKQCRVGRKSHMATKRSGGGFARPPSEDGSEEDEVDVDAEWNELQIVVSTKRPRPRMTAMKSTGGGRARTIRRTARKCTGGYAAYTRKAPAPAEDVSDEGDEDLDDESQFGTFTGRPRARMTAMKSTGGGRARTVRRTARKCTGGYVAYTRKAPAPAEDVLDEDEEDLDDEPQFGAFTGRPRPRKTAMKSTGGGRARTVRRTVRKCTGGYVAYTRKAPPPAEDVSEEDEEELVDEPQFVASCGRSRMTAMKSTGGRRARSIRRTARKCTGGYATYTRKAPPPTVDDSEEDEEDEDFEGEDGSVDKNDAESVIEDEEGLDEEKSEVDESAENVEQKKETESSNADDVAGEMDEGDAKECVASKRKRLLE